MAVMRQSDFSSILAPGLRKVFFLHMKEVPTEYSRWINIVSSKRAYEDDHKISEFGTVPEKTEGQSVAFEAAIAASTRRYTHRPFALGYVITREMIDDDLYGPMKKMTQALRRSFRNLREVESYRPLNNPTSAATRYAGIDSLALLSTAHTRLDGGTTQQNRPTTMVDLSRTAVEAAVLNFHGILGDKGLPAFYTPRIAIVAGNDQYKAAQIFRNAAEYGPDSNGINTYIASRYLTDTDSWFILSDKGEHQVHLFDRVGVEFDMHDDFYTGNALGKGYTRIIAGHTDWRGVYGSTGS
jgi:hypothetical protein